MKLYKLRMLLGLCLILLMLPLSQVCEPSNKIVPREALSLALEDAISQYTPSTQSEGIPPAAAGDVDLGSLIDKANEYEMIWEPWITKAAVHAVATSEDKDLLAVGGGYLYDNEIHIYRWNLQRQEYDRVWDSGDGIIKGDVLSLAFGDTDNNKFTEIVAGSADGHVYVFEQSNIYDPIANTENQFELVWTSPKLRPVFSVAVKDTDIDGSADIIAGSWDGKVHVYEYKEHSGYPFSTQHWIKYAEVWNSGDTESEKITAVTTGDTNCNGLPEIIVGTMNGSIRIFENNGTVLPIGGTMFPLPNDNKYIPISTITQTLWKPILSLDSGDLDMDLADEVAVNAAGQGVYVLDYQKPQTTANNGRDGIYKLNKLTRPLETWELGAGTNAGYPLDYYVNDIVSAVNVHFSTSSAEWPEPLDYKFVPNRLMIYPESTAMAGPPDENYSTFRPYLIASTRPSEFINQINQTFPDPTAWWIWNDVQSGEMKNATMPGQFWVKREFDVEGEAELAISIAAKDYYYAYLDREFLGNGSNVNLIGRYQTYVRPGKHVLGMLVGNEGPDSSSAGLLVSVRDLLSKRVLFNSQGDGTWRTNCSALLDFGKDEEVTGNGNSSPDIILYLNKTVDDFSLMKHIIREEFSLSFSQDNSDLAVTSAADLQFSEDSTARRRFKVMIDLDRILAEKHWDYVRYMNITANSLNQEYYQEVYGGIPKLYYGVDSVEAKTLYRPMSSATSLTIGSLSLNSSDSVQEFQDRLQAGGEYKNAKKQQTCLLIGTADGRLVTYCFNESSNSYCQIWDSYAEDRSNLKTAIWDIQQVKTPGKMPTWMLPDQSTASIYYCPLSFSYHAPNYASSTFANNFYRSEPGCDLVIGSKNGQFTCPTNALVTSKLQTASTWYGGKWVSAAFGKLDATISDYSELLVGYYNQTSGESGLDYWFYPFGSNVSLSNMECTGLLSEVLKTSLTLPKAALADMDGDGDLDVTFTNGKIYYLENIGNKTDPSFELKPDYYSSLNLNSSGKVFSSPQLVDFDRDGDFDLIVGYANKLGVTYYENRGTPQNPEWVENRRLFHNRDNGFLEGNFTDPMVCSILGLYKMIWFLTPSSERSGLPSYSDFNQSYVDTFGTNYALCAYNNDTTKQSIMSLVGDVATHGRFVIATNPLIQGFEVALSKGQLTNYGYHVLSTWNNDDDLEGWTLTVTSGDVNEDGKDEVVVGDFDNNLYVFEHLSNNTYKRAFRSLDLNHTVELSQSPYAWQQLEGLAGKFNRTIMDHVEQLVVANIERNGTPIKEIVAVADMSVYVFEFTGLLNQYKLAWHEDLRKSQWGSSLEEAKIEKISALSFSEDLDKNDYGEILLGAGGNIFKCEARDDGTFSTNTTFPFTNDRTTTIRAIVTGDLDSDGNDEIVVGGASGQDGTLSVMKKEAAGYSVVWKRASADTMKESPVNAITIDDQDCDGRKELIVGHEHGINIWEYSGTANSYSLQEIMTSSPNYPQCDMTISAEGNISYPIRMNRKNNDIIQLSNGTLLQIYSKETLNQTDLSRNYDAIRLFFRTSDDNGVNWTPETRVYPFFYPTQILPKHSVNRDLYGELEPSVVKTGDNVWFTWWTVWKHTFDGGTDIALYAMRAGSSLVLSDFVLLAELSIPQGGLPWNYGTLQVLESGKGYSPAIWNYGDQSVAVSYIDVADGKVHWKAYEEEGNNWLWIDKGTLPFIDNNSSLAYTATSMDMITLNNGTKAMVFAGQYRNESKPDDDIWVMINGTKDWNQPTRVTIDSSEERNPSITQLKSQDGTIMIAFESKGGIDSIMVSYSKDLGRTWSEPESLESEGKLASPSLAARNGKGYFYSYAMEKNVQEKEVVTINGRRITFYYFAFLNRILVGMNPSSDWTKYDVGDVSMLAVGDTDNDGRREIAANCKNSVAVYEIRKAGDSFQEHMKAWVSPQLAETPTDVAIGDPNGNGWQELIISAKKGNVYSYEIVDKTTPRATGYHDLTVANVKISKNVINRERSVNINVTIENRGNFTETVNVEIYANTTMIDVYEITLANKSSLTTTFTWDSTDFNYGNYTISAKVTPVSGETNVDDNTLIDGTVTVTIAGDVNADGKVNCKDVYAVAKAYGTSLEGSNPPGRTYEPNCDINGDGKVDVKDYYIVCKHYGETTP